MFIPLFTVSQTIGLPGTINLQDTSTGSDAAIVQRNVFLVTNAVAYLVPSGTTTNYTPWVLANPTIAINALDKDYSLQVTVNWIDVGGTVLYTLTKILNFQMYNANFEYSLISIEANGLASLNSPNWLKSRMELRLAIDDAQNAVLLASSITNGQQANDRGTELRKNLNKFY